MTFKLIAGAKTLGVTAIIRRFAIFCSVGLIAVALFFEVQMSMEATRHIHDEHRDSLGFSPDALHMLTTVAAVGTADDSEEETKKKTTPGERLNVLIFYADDWRHDDLGGLTPVLQTPFFSRVAQEGIRFTHNAVTTSICWISRATLFTGQYVHRHLSHWLKTPRFASETLRWQRTWPYLLKHKAGYHIGHIGKWQYHQTGYSLKQLFDFASHFESISMWMNVKGERRHIIDHARIEAIRFLRERPKDCPFATTIAFLPPKGGSDPVYATNESLTLYQDKIIPEHPSFRIPLNHLPDFLQNNRTLARSRFLWRFEHPMNYQTTMKTYYSLISHIDQACASIVQELEDQGILNQTLIIVTADNGEFHAAHSLADKWYPYEESIRVPLLMRDPRMPLSQRGGLKDEFTLNIDLAPTILAAAGLPIDPGMQGRNIAELYSVTPDGDENEVLQPPWREEFYYEFPDVQGFNAIPPSSALVRKEYKFLTWHKRQYEQLFNLKADPYELHDLHASEAHQEIMDEMRRRLEILRARVSEPFDPLGDANMTGW